LKQGPFASNSNKSVLIVTVLVPGEQCYYESAELRSALVGNAKVQAVGHFWIESCEREDGK